MSTEPLMLTALDLFSGVGGLSAGWLASSHDHGGVLLAAVDSDPLARPVVERNFPGSLFLEHELTPTESGDAKAIARAVSLDPGDLDILLAGPPCQAVSTAGKRTEEHPNNRLALRVAELARELNPKAVVIENVPEFASVEGGRLLGRLRVQLGDAGYVTQVGVLNSSAFGIPQVRHRFFVVGVTQGRFRRDPRSLLPIPRTASVLSARVPLADSRSDLPLPPTVEQALGDLPPLNAGEGSEIADYLSPPRSTYAASIRRESRRLFNHVSVGHSAEMVAALAKLKPGETPQLVASHDLRPRQYFRSAYARLVPNGLAPTMTTQTHNPGSGRFTHYAQDRVLTVREVARIQSFPDEFVFLGDNSVQRRHVGNAVPPQLAEAITAELIPYLR